MLFKVSRVKQKVFRMFKKYELYLESFGLRLKNWLWKG